MGYLSIDVDQYDSLEDAFVSELIGGKIVLMIERAGAYFCAVRHSDGTISATVVLEGELDGERMFKAIPEEMVPVASICPIQILRLLTPSKSPDVNDWREQCWTWNIRLIESAINGQLDIAQQVNGGA